MNAAKYILIAVGGWPNKPDIPGIDLLFEGVA